MVSTRNHPKQFPESPTKRSTSRSISPAVLVPTIDAALDTPASTTSSTMAPPATPATVSRGRGRPRTTTAAAGWAHQPTLLTRIWLLVSLPLVLWDTGYVLGRPHTLPGGAWHAPLWMPYELYGRVDLIYSPAAYARGEGFTGAQGLLNVVETALYLVYAAMVYGKSAGGVGGRRGGLAALVGFAAAVMTLSKTVLYWLVVYCSGWEHVKNNSMQDFIVLWVIPNGAWLVFPAYMTWSFGADMLRGLEQASETPRKKTQ